MSSLESLVPSLEVCGSLVAHGITLDTALAWYPTREVGAVSATVWVVDAMSSDALCPAPTLSELLLSLNHKSEADTLVALAHALLALREEELQSDERADY